MVAIKLILAGVFFVSLQLFAKMSMVGIDNYGISVIHGATNVSGSTQTEIYDSLPGKNQQILNYVIKNGAKISPTYESSVCTELLIGVLKNFILLDKEEKKRIRIITEENVHQLRLNHSPVPKGVYYALTESKKGIAIDHLQDVRPGDFVQFWYWSWGHCGIVKSINTEEGTMDLYSSYPTTNGYGIQTFNIPRECYFVRLK